MSQSGRAGIESFVEPTCSPWGCGTNSATVGDGVVFDELDGSGMTEIRGVKIIAANLGSVPVRLEVTRDVLSAVSTDGTDTHYTGLNLVGLKIKLMATLQTGEHRSYELTFEDVSPNQKDRPQLTYWAGDHDPIPSYLITVRPEDATCKPVPICKIHPPAGEPIPTGLEHDAIVFEGDHYKPAEKQVDDTTTGKPSSIFNLACAGAAPAKMQLMRHTSAGGWTADGALGSDGLPPFYTTPAERQAMLKMFTADYCGAGRSFTVDGQDLLYADARHWYSTVPVMRHDGTVAPGDGTVEALWDEHGAVCLDKPRPARVPPDARTTTADPVIRRNVEEACTSSTPQHDLPPCTGTGGVLTKDPVPPYHVISVVPPVR